MQTVFDLARALDQQKQAIRSVVSMTCPNVTVIFKSTGACTDGKTIWLPETRALLRVTMSAEEITDMQTYMCYVWGAAWHEIAHCLWTDFDVLSTKHYTAKKPLQHCTNLYEDIRVNNVLVNTYKGCSTYLQNTYNYIFNKAYKRYSENKPSIFVQILLAISYRARYGVGYKKTSIWRMFEKRVRRFVVKTRKLHDKVKNDISSTTEAIQCAKTLLRLIKLEGFDTPEDEKNTGDSENPQDAINDDKTEHTTQHKTNYVDSDDANDDDTADAVGVSVDNDEDVNSNQTTTDTDTFAVTEKDTELLDGSAFISADTREAITGNASLCYVNYNSTDSPVYKVWTTENDDVTIKDGEDALWLAQYITRKNQYVVRSDAAQQLISALTTRKNAPILRDQPEGDLDDDNLSALVSRTSNDVFKAEATTVSFATSVEISVDCSGSMYSRIDRIRNLILDLTSSLEKTEFKFAVNVWSSGPASQALTVYRAADRQTRKAFSRFGSIWFKVLKDYAAPVFKQHRIMGIHARQNSYDAESLMLSATRLLSTNSTRRILILFVDGEPTPPDTGIPDLVHTSIKTQQKALHDVVAWIRKQAIELLVFSLDAPNVVRYYDEACVVNVSDADDFGAVVLPKIKKILLSPTRK